MSDMGLAEYCHDINHMNAGRLIEQFQGLEKNAEKLKPRHQAKSRTIAQGFGRAVQTHLQKCISRIVSERSARYHPLAQPLLLI